jgi:predicted MFS family arabinose efflux permease
MMVGMLGLAVATVGFSLASNYWVLILARIGQGSAGGASWYVLTLRRLCVFHSISSKASIFLI